MEHSKTPEPQSGTRAVSRRRPSRSRRAQHDGFALHVRWQPGPRTQAWDELWRWLLSDTVDADEVQPHDEVG